MYQTNFVIENSIFSSAKAYNGGVLNIYSRLDLINENKIINTIFSRNTVKFYGGVIKN